MPLHTGEAWSGQPAIASAGRLNSVGLIVVWVFRAKLIPGSFGFASSAGTKYFHSIW